MRTFLPLALLVLAGAAGVVAGYPDTGPDLSPPQQPAPGPPPPAVAAPDVPAPAAPLAPEVPGNAKAPPAGAPAAAKAAGGAPTTEVKSILGPKRVEFPGGILDAGRKTAYLASADETIEAVDLATGDVLWKTVEAQVPILVVGDKLFAQAGVKRNRLRVLAFNVARKGECLLESDPVVFPRWVVTGASPLGTFVTRWDVEGTRLILDWEADGWAEASTLTTHRQPSTRKHADGTAWIDLESGEVETGPARPVTKPEEPKLPRQLEKQAVRWFHTYPYSYKFVAVVLEDVPPPSEDPERTRDGFGVMASRSGERAYPPRVPWQRKQRLVYRSWDTRTGQPLARKELMRGNRPVIHRVEGDDYLCVRDSAPTPDEMVHSTADKNLDWLVIDGLGRPCGRIPYVAGTQVIQLRPPLAFYLVAGPVSGPIDRPNLRPQSVQAYELATGKKRWEKAVAGKYLSPLGR